MCVFAYFTHQYTTRLDIYHTNTIDLARKTFHATVNSFELSHESFHAIYADEISLIVAQSNNASQQKREKLREDLNTLLIDFYNATTLHALTGLTFVDKEGFVLLRIHHPRIYDDNIQQQRPSFEKMAKSFLYKKGFEVGSYQQAYRYQYPLFYDGRYVGAYEYSVNFEHILREMKKIYANEYMLLLDENNIKVGRFEQERYEYIQNEGFLENLDQLQKAKIFDYNYEGRCYSLVVCPIKDINEKQIGSLLVDVLQSPRGQYRKDFMIEMSFALFLGLLVFIFSYRKKQYSRYVRELINIQKQMLIVTNGTQLIDANDTFFRFFHYKNLKEFVHKHDCVCDFFLEDEGCIGKFVDGFLWTEYIQKYPEQKHCVKILDDDGAEKFFELDWVLFEKTSNLFISFRDITQELHEKRALENRANYDNLTGLYNRERFYHYLDKYIVDAKQQGQDFSVIMFDIDYFKKINDTLGHDMGDSVLSELASLVSSKIREGDIFARWGGEEFMIIAPLALSHAHSFAEKLRRVIQTHRFTGVQELQCSFGVSSYRSNETKESFLKRVDEQLYKAKHRGRNCVISA